VTRPRANCPNCGAPIEFQWSSSVQTVCTYCRSILVRSDVDLTKVGTVADLPPDSSPIQLHTEGVYNKRAFVVAGRIIYEYDQGYWNEWHICLNDGASGWLSDAQCLYGVTFASGIKPLPLSSEAQIGQRYDWNNTRYQVTSITKARYRGVEGELPFQYWDKEDAIFVDLRNATNAFATLDYSDDAPVLYLGESVSFDDLKLKNLRPFEGWS
jgi:uncharacterized protein DUF4178